MTTSQLEIELQKSKEEDEKFLKFTETHPILSEILFEDMDGGFELNIFKGIVLGYDFNKKWIYVQEPNSVTKYQHWITFNSVKNEH